MIDKCVGISAGFYVDAVNEDVLDEGTDSNKSNDSKYNYVDAGDGNSGSTDDLFSNDSSITADDEEHN